MYKVRRWVVRHSRSFETIYQLFEKLLVKLHPLLAKIGYQRMEKPVAKLEQLCKGLLFDCKMCGQCALSSTGMSCSMNCPKNLRNGPCGGVRQNGNCEVKPQMRCVWMDAWQGSQAMLSSDRIHIVQLPVSHNLQGTSAWLRKVRQVVQYQESKKR
ncbi:MAG: hypothetical protein OFPII_07660 [Osedax symbiont Rs1]|nr:MAG: hypothetical protein OFPII_07660 [Osedax symbiont Rs1]